MISYLNTHFEGAWSNTVSIERSVDCRRVPPPSLVIGKCVCDPHAPIWYSTFFPMRRGVRAHGASSSDAPPPPRSLAVDRSSYPPGFPVWYLDLLLLVLLVFGCQFVPRVSLFFFSDCL